MIAILLVILSFVLYAEKQKQNQLQEKNKIEILKLEQERLENIKSFISL